MEDTIFALSSGPPPAAIAVLRISGPSAIAAATRLAGPLPPPRRAALRRLRDAGGEELDRALVLVFPRPTSATGEDLVELHLHGGRAVVRAVETALAASPGLRSAEPGEFTRRALAYGIVDLAQVEGLGDLLAAETESARRAALAVAEGAVSRSVTIWDERLLALAARAEALIDFADEDDVADDHEAEALLRSDCEALAAELEAAASRPRSERLRDGIRVVLAGPPNSGKSTLLNALAERDVAIASPVAGTTRDRIEVPLVRDGIAWVLIDVAGLRDTTDDPIEAAGIERARTAMAEADLVVWLGDDAPPAADMLAVQARADLPGRATSDARLAVSAVTGRGLRELWDLLGKRGTELLPRPDSIAFNARQSAILAAAAATLQPIERDLILTAEQLRMARASLAVITGVSGVEPLLDVLFRKFCIGK